MQQVPLRYSVREGGVLARSGSASNVIVKGEPMMVAPPTITTLSDYMNSMGNATPRTRAVAQSAIRLEPKQEQLAQQAAPMSPYGLSVGPAYQTQRHDTAADWYPPTGETVLPAQAIPIAPNASQVWTFQQPRVEYAGQQQMQQQSIRLSQPMMQAHHLPSAQVIQQAQQQNQFQQQAACTTCPSAAAATTIATTQAALPAQAQFVQQQALQAPPQAQFNQQAALNRSAPLQQQSLQAANQQYLSEQLAARCPMPKALLDDIINFNRSKLRHVAWPIYTPKHFFFTHSLRPLGACPLPAELLQEIRMCPPGGVGFLRHSPAPCAPSLRFRLGPKFRFANYMDQRAAFLAGKPSNESAGLLSRDRDYEHGRPVSIADRVKDALRVGHTGPPSPQFRGAVAPRRGAVAGQRSVSWPRYAGIGTRIMGKIKHTLGLDKPTIDASYFKPEEAEVNYSASSGLIPTMKSTVTSVTVTVKDKLAGVTDAIKSTVNVAGDVVKETLGLSSQAATDSAVTSSSADAMDSTSMYSSNSNELPADRTASNLSTRVSYASVASSGNTDPAVTKWSGQRGL